VLLLSGRSTVLSGLFLLAALLALEERRHWAAALLFVLACTSRETALAGLLPLIVLTAGRPGVHLRSALRELAPTLLGAVAVLAWILVTPRYLQLAEFSFLGRPFWHSLASQIGAVPVGLGLLFNPSALSIDYGIALPTHLSAPLFLLGVALYIAAAAGILLLLQRSRIGAIGLALWLAALLPTQSVVPKLDALTNRPLGLALAGLLLVATPLLATAMTRSSERSTTAVTHRQTGMLPLRSRMVVMGSAALLCALLAIATSNRAALFRSELALWQDAASKSRSNFRPHLQYAVLLIRAGNITQARESLRVAQRLDPFSSEVAAFTQVYLPLEASR
jgi:hypothetical protein